MSKSYPFTRLFRFYVLIGLRKSRHLRARQMVSVNKLVNLVGKPDLHSDGVALTQNDALFDLALRIACARGVPAEALLK